MLDIYESRNKVFCWICGEYDEFRFEFILVLFYLNICCFVVVIMCLMYNYLEYKL